MYRFSKEQVLDPVFLTKLIRRFKREQVPRFIRNQRYYEVKTEILDRTMTDGKPNNKLAHGFCRYITNMATSYFAGKPIRYIFTPADEDSKEEAGLYKKTVLDVFKANYIDSLNFEVAKESSKKGIGFYLLFSNEEADIRIKKMDAETFIPIYSTSLDEFLEAAVHIWSEYDIEGLLVAEYADVYDEELIYHFKRLSGEIVYSQSGVSEPHMMGDIPVIVVWNNEEQMGDYEPVITLNDAYDNAQSDTANDMDYFTDAYLCITGASSMMEDALTDDGDEGEGDGKNAAVNLRKNRILFLDDNGQASWLTKNVNDVANENYKDRLYKDIFFLSQVPALTDENFSGNLSGIAIKYKMTGLEELAIMKENRMRSAQTKMIRIITHFLNTKMNKSWNPDVVEQKYDRNFVDNISDIITDVRNIDGIVSRETQLDMLPISVVSDTSAEIERQRKEAMEAENLPRVDIDDL